MAEKDTRGWKSKSVGETKELIPGSRSGSNPTPRRIAKTNYVNDIARIDEKGVPMDNMGNSHGNPGVERPLFNEAQNVDVAPAVPLSSFDGPGDVADGKGIGLSMEAGTQPDLHPREVRDKTDHAPESSSVQRGAIDGAHPAWSRARIPLSKEMHSSIFTGDGNNPSQEESGGEKADHARIDPEFKKGRAKIRKGSNDYA